MWQALCPKSFLSPAMIVALVVAITASSQSARSTTVPPETPPETPPDASAASQPPFAVAVHGEGHPVLLIPGLGSDGSVWDATVEALVAEGYQTHVFTLAGFAGQPPLALGADTDFLTAVRDAVTIYARTLEEPPALVGHSLGGTLSLWLAATQPELFGPVVAVDGVAFLPALLDPNATEASGRAQAQRMAGMLGGMTGEAYDAQAAFTFASMITDPAVARQVAEASRGTDPKTVAAAMGALLSRDLRGELATIQSPVLLLAAGAAAPTPEAAAQLAARYEAQVAAVPDHRVEVVAEARHFIMLDQPERFLVLLRQHLAGHAKRALEEATAR